MATGCARRDRMTAPRTRLCCQVGGLVQGQLLTQRLHMVPRLLVKLKLAQRFVSSFHVSYPLYITISPVEIAPLGQLWAQILQCWQKLRRPKSMGLSATSGMSVRMAAALKPSPR